MEEGRFQSHSLKDSFLGEGWTYVELCQEQVINILKICFASVKPLRLGLFFTITKVSLP